MDFVDGLDQTNSNSSSAAQNTLDLDYHKQECVVINIGSIKTSQQQHKKIKSWLSDHTQPSNTDGTKKKKLCFLRDNQWKMWHQIRMKRSTSCLISWIHDVICREGTGNICVNKCKSRVTGVLCFLNLKYTRFYFILFCPVGCCW